jgi:hypothetical protein
MNSQRKINYLSNSVEDQASCSKKRCLLLSVRLNEHVNLSFTVCVFRPLLHKERSKHWICSPIDQHIKIWSMLLTNETFTLLLVEFSSIDDKQMRCIVNIRLWLLSHFIVILLIYIFLILIYFALSFFI